MKNLEQIRAASALGYCKSGAVTGGREGGNVLKKLPALIMGNGLMAAGAFAYAQKENGWRNCFDALAKHLAHPDVAILRGCQGLDGMMEKLADADSQTLKLATEETLAWLSFARRFEKPSEETDHDSDE